VWELLLHTEGQNCDNNIIEQVTDFKFDIFHTVVLNLIKLINSSNTTIGESQVKRYSIKLPGLHVSVCRDHHQVLRAKD